MLEMLVSYYHIYSVTKRLQWNFLIFRVYFTKISETESYIAKLKYLTRRRAYLKCDSRAISEMTGYIVRRFMRVRRGIS